MKNILGSFLLAATLVGVGACTVRGQAQVTAPTATVEVDEDPPPPRSVVVESRPGFVFLEGHWYRSGGRWEWQDGHWERERAGQSYVVGRWDRRGNKRVWVEGRWQAGGGTVVRDHRDAPPPAAPPPDDVTRDHRH